MNAANALFRPLTIKHLTIRNRVFSTGHAPMYSKDGRPTERYIRYHEEKAKGGIGLTIFGGATSVAVDAWASYWSNLTVKDDSCIPDLQRFADAIHTHGAAAMIQLTHIGRKMRWDSDPWFTPISASRVREPHHRSFPKAAEDWDLRRATRDYAQAVRRCRDAGLDGCEILFCQQHLVDQFWSPLTNQRSDHYGGSFENRMRFGCEMLEAVRAEVGCDFVVGVRMSGDEFLTNGLGQTDLLAIARYYSATGLIDFINVNASHVQTLDGLANNVPNMSYPVAPYLALASAIKKEVDVKIFHATRITDVDTAARAIEEGHVDMIGMTRAHIADPHIVKKLGEGRADEIRQCVGAGYCIDRVYGADALCIQNAATGRERTLPHVIQRGPRKYRVVIVGAGPGGLEAARVSAERGHEVTLFEATDRPGGQINLAIRAPWREALSGITRWLDQQVRRLGVDLRCAQTATAAMVMALKPDLVVVATGGYPNKGNFQGAELAASSWDVLEGKVAPAKRVLFFDDNGQQQGPSVVEYMAQRGALVELVTPDREAAAEVGVTNMPVHMRSFYKHGVIITPDRRLTQVYAEGDHLIAVLSSEFGAADEEREIDQVICEHGTLPNEDLYWALRADSLNHGECDLTVLAEEDRVVDVVNNEGGKYRLYRIGDAVASRNIHAAIYDALRLCHTL